MVLLLLKFIVFVAVIYFFGWSFSRRVLKQNELYLLVPLSMFSGIFAYVFFANILGYIVPINISFYLTYFLMLIGAAGLKYFLKAEEMRAGIDTRHLKILAAVTIASSLVFALIIKDNFQYDPDWHYSLTASIANGNFPVKNVFAPFNYAQYHYAFDLLSASLVSTLSLDAMQGTDLAYVLYFVFIFWLVFALVYKMIASLSMAYISSVLFFLGGGFRYFTILRDVKWHSVHGIASFLGELSRNFRAVEPLGPGYFHEYSISPFGVIIYHSSSFFAYPLVVFIIYLMFLEDENKSLLYKILLGLSLGFLALSSEVAFVFLAVAWGLWKLLKFPKEKKKIAISIATVALISSFVAIYQGGIITDALLHASPKSAEGADMAISSFKLRSFPGLTSFGGFYPFNKAYSYAFMFVEWGFLLLLFPFAAYLAVKNDKRILKLLLIAIGLSLLVAFNIDYPVSSDNLSRLNVFAFILMSFLAAYFLSILYDKNKKYKALSIAIICLTVISPLFFNIKLLFTDHKSLDEKIIDLEGDIDLNGEKDFAGKVKNLVPENAIVLTANPFVVNIIWGRLSYFGTPTEKANFYRIVEKDLKNIINDKGIEELRKKKVDYIYLNKDLVKYGGKKFVDDNKKELKEVFRDKDRVLYEIKEI